MLRKVFLSKDIPGNLYFLLYFTSCLSIFCEQVSKIGTILALYKNGIIDHWFKCWRSPPSAFLKVFIDDPEFSFAVLSIRSFWFFSFSTRSTISSAYLVYFHILIFSPGPVVSSSNIFQCRHWKGGGKGYNHGTLLSGFNASLKRLLQALKTLLPV